MELPNGGNGKRFPRRVVELGFEKVARALIGMRHPVEAPGVFAVERLIPRGFPALVGEGLIDGGVWRESGAGGLAIDLEDLLVFPIGESGGEGGERRECEAGESREERRLGKRGISEKRNGAGGRRGWSNQMPVHRGENEAREGSFMKYDGGE
jgi:hypothetical protein